MIGLRKIWKSPWIPLSFTARIRSVLRPLKAIAESNREHNALIATLSSAASVRLNGINIKGNHALNLKMMRMNGLATQICLTALDAMSELKRLQAVII